MNDKASPNFYVTVVFENEAERDAFMREISMPIYEQYITADQVRRIEKSPG